MYKKQDMQAGVLMGQLVTDYERDGVIRIRKLFTKNEIEEIRNEINRYEREILADIPESDKVFEADGKTVRNLWNLHKHDTFFDQLTQRAELIQLAEKLVHGQAELRHTALFNKPAQIGSSVPYHQDNAYWCQSPPDLFTLWIAVDAATIENGAVYYQLGTQHKMYPHKPSGVKGNSTGLADPPPQDPSQEFCGTLEPGDALIHHCQTIHRSEPNTSDQSRRGLLLIYRGLHTQTDPALKQAYEVAVSALDSKG